MRRAIGILFALLVLLAVLYPPWTLIRAAPTHSWTVGVKFAPLWSPPPPAAAPFHTINTGMLALEILALGVAGAFALIATKKT